MSVIPKKKAERIEFCEDHVAPWTTNAVAIGTNVLVVQEFATKTAAARNAYDASRAAANAARAATVEYDLALAAMTDAAADIIKHVRAKAATAGDAVFALAEIPAPATPGPRAAPGTPYEFTVKLDGDGALDLAWKCTNPPGAAGTMYTVYRQIGGAGEYASLGVTGQRTFIDATIPAGATQITYKIRGVRSTVGGPWATFNVFVGTNAGGGLTATLAAPSAPKLAA